MAFDWIRLARPLDWALSKLPFALGGGLLLVPELTATQLLAMCGSVAAWASFGFGVNEIADRATDPDGRANRAVDLGRASWLAFLGVTAAAAVGLAAVWAADAAAPALVACGLLLSLAYSVRPARLKERGAAGLVAAALAQWTLPVLAIAAADPGGWMQLPTAVYALLGLAIGVRWMAVHQLSDISNDRRAGVRTFAALGGPAYALIVLAFAAELVLLAAVFVATWPRSTAAALAFGLWGVAGSLLRNPFKGLVERLSAFATAPLATYYFVVLPAAMALEWVDAPDNVWARGLVAALGGLVAGKVVRTVVLLLSPLVARGHQGPPASRRAD